MTNRPIDPDIINLRLELLAVEVDYWQDVLCRALRGENLSQGCEARRPAAAPQSGVLDKGFSNPAITAPRHPAAKFLNEIEALIDQTDRVQLTLEKLHDMASS